jgi:hypothetical protein
MNINTDDLIHKKVLNLDPKIWWPRYEFVIQSMIVNYPHQPTDAIQKQMYDIIMNIPFWIPHEKMASITTKLLEDYPVSSFLTSRKAFMKWGFEFCMKMRRRINTFKKHSVIPFKEITYYEFLQNYHHEYLPPEIKDKKYRDFINRIKFGTTLTIMALTVGYLTYKDYIDV